MVHARRYGYSRLDEWCVQWECPRINLLAPTVSAPQVRGSIEDQENILRSLRELIWSLIPSCLAFVLEIGIFVDWIIWGE